MEKKKTKLTLSGNLKKSISNIERAKSHGKNAVVIEKRNNKFSNKRTFNTSSKNSSNFKIDRSSYKSRPPSLAKPTSPSSDYEKRKLAEQRATKRLKDDPEKRDNKGKIGSKKRELKLTISRALSGDEEGRSRSLAALKRAKQKENRIVQKDNSLEKI